MKSMTLYHYTSVHHLPAILQSGFLKTTESNISLRKEHAGPDVVWFTSHPDPVLGHGLKSALYNKREVRIAVELDARQVMRWRDWARAHGSDQRTMGILAQAGGAASWWVSERAVPMSSWASVQNVVTGETISFEGVAA